jgi:hypothetical protein
VAEHAATGKLHDRAHVIGIIVADENEAMKRHAPTVERLDREERVVDRPKGGPRAQDQRQAPVREYVDLQLAPGDRHQQPAGTLDDQHSIGRRHGQRLRLDLDTIQLGGAMRRERLGQNKTLGQKTVVGQLRRRLHVLPIGALGSAGLDRLPVQRIKSQHEHRRNCGLADARVGAGNDVGLVHADRKVGSNARCRRRVSAIAKAES